MDDIKEITLEANDLEARLHNAEFMIHLMGIIIKETLPAEPNYRLNLMLKQYYDASKMRGSL